MELPDYKSRRAGFYKGIGNPLIGLPDYKSGRAAEIKILLQEKQDYNKLDRLGRLRIPSFNSR
jgi:hypothetical protein